ncbi:MAG TPA: hypothetical protein VFP50_04990 [Anaeromyxobacteraceae bacterium]|nr:hypothetical protein [Anaeromyxobacteraceae bacterium]
MRPLSVLAAAALSAGCLAEPKVGPAQPGGAGSVATTTLSSIETNIFVPKCATSACHAGSPPANAPVSLEAGRAWLELVGVPSTQAPMSLVEPSNPAASYLLYKVRGTQGLVGGLSPMPPASEPLSDGEVQAIEGWIARGAPND